MFRVRFVVTGVSVLLSKWQLTQLIHVIQYSLVLPEKIFRKPLGFKS